jgi:hypothetical protein
MLIKYIQHSYSNSEDMSNKFENSFKHLLLIYNHLPDDLMFLSSDSEFSESEVNLSWSEHRLAFINGDYIKVMIYCINYYPVIIVY